MAAVPDRIIGATVYRIAASPEFRCEDDTPASFSIGNCQFLEL
jgi:hypothetical protein